MLLPGSLPHENETICGLHGLPEVVVHVLHLGKLGNPSLPRIAATRCSGFSVSEILGAHAVMVAYPA
jgi:hypothetical protein